MTRLFSLGSGPDFSAKPVLWRAGVAVVAGTILAILGPFGSYTNGDPVRLAAYWIGSMLLGAVLYGATYAIVSRRISRNSSRWWPTLLAATLLISVPEALATHVGAFWLWPKLAQLRLPWPLWFAQTVSIGLVSMVAVSTLVRRSAPSKYDPELALSTSGSVAALGGDVLALQMEDHYVRVHRRTGSELILLPLGQAIQRVEPEGLRTHRSWWVAGHAVTGVEGDARSMCLILSNGVVAPVARSAVARLRAAGWITHIDKRIGV